MSCDTFDTWCDMTNLQKIYYDVIDDVTRLLGPHGTSHHGWPESMTRHVGFVMVQQLICQYLRYGATAWVTGDDECFFGVQDRVVDIVYRYVSGGEFETCATLDVSHVVSTDVLTKSLMMYWWWMWHKIKIAVSDNHDHHFTFVQIDVSWHDGSVIHIGQPVLHLAGASYC